MTHQSQTDALVERLRKPTDADAIYDKIISLRKQTRSDLPRQALCNEFDLLDEERLEAADAIEALRRTPDPVPVAGEVVFPVEQWIAYCVRYGPSCRDCADEDGACPSTGIACGERGKAVRYVLEALVYGWTHGFTPTPALSTSSVQPEREGFVLVPREPTEEMLVTGWFAASMRHPDQCSMEQGVEVDVWQAMLAASPLPSGQVDGSSFVSALREGEL